MGFKEYWNNLKTGKPELYQEKLKSNRERIRRLRAEIYKDPEKHKAYKERQRERYKQRKALKTAKTE